MTDYSHLDAIELWLSHERARIATAKNVKERGWREHNVRMIEKELEGERKFLGLAPEAETQMSIDEILKELKD